VRLTDDEVVSCPPDIRSLKVQVDRLQETVDFSDLALHLTRTFRVAERHQPALVVFEADRAAELELDGKIADHVEEPWARTKT
jgi:hypothetical protein